MSKGLTKVEVSSHYVFAIVLLAHSHNVDILLVSMIQPGYLHNLLPDSAPDHPETVEQVLDGELN